MAGKGIVLLGVSRDSLASHDRFIRTFGSPSPCSPTPMRHDDGLRRLCEKVQYGKKSMGTIRSTVVVGRRTVKKQWSKVAKGESHPAQVLPGCSNGS